MAPPMDASVADPIEPVQPGVAAHPGPPEHGTAQSYRMISSRGLPREHGFEPLRVEGALPPELRGTLYRTGPGAFELFGRPYRHLFEADGAVTAVRFGGGGALGACRLIESAGLSEERAAGRMLYGTGAAWPSRAWRSITGRMKNTGNTSILPFQGRLFALMEAALPTEIHPDSLETLGEHDLGAIPRAFSAHPHGVASRGTRYNFGLNYGPRTHIDLLELPAHGPARHLGHVPAPATLLHDFIVTDRHLVFFVPPVRANIPRLLFQIGSFDRMFDWRPTEGTEVVIVPIDDPTAPIRFHTDAFHQWHFANAFERKGELVIDFVRYPDFASFEMLAGAAGVVEQRAEGYLHRAVVDPARRTLRSDALWDVPCEFPRVAPEHEGADYRACWVLTDGARHSIARVDVTGGISTAWALPAHQLASEPVFVPRAGPRGVGEGYILSLVYDARADASFAAVLDAQRLEEGPVARAWFDHHIPLTFHGDFVPA